MPPRLPFQYKYPSLPSRHLDIGICWMASPHPNPEFHRRIIRTINLSLSHQLVHVVLRPESRSFLIERGAKNTSPPFMLNPPKKAKESKRHKKKTHGNTNTGKQREKTLQKWSITSSPPLTNTKHEHIQRHHATFSGHVSDISRKVWFFFVPPLLGKRAELVKAYGYKKILECK